jgi:hypothetical protein
MDETHKKAMETHGEMNPEMKKLHEEIMEAHKDLSPEDAEKMHKLGEQMHHLYGTDCGHVEHEAFVKKIDGMDKKLDKIMKALKMIA